MELYKLDSKLKESSCGMLEFGQTIEELESISANAGKTYQDETEAIPTTHFILFRDDKNFLRVECHSVDEAHFPVTGLSTIKDG